MGERQSKIGDTVEKVHKRMNAKLDVLAGENPDEVIKRWTEAFTPVVLAVMTNMIAYRSLARLSRRLHEHGALSASLTVREARRLWFPTAMVVWALAGRARAGVRSSDMLHATVTKGRVEKALSEQEGRCA